MKRVFCLLLIVLALFVISCGASQVRTSKYGPNPQMKRMPLLPAVEEVTAYRE